LDPCQWLVHYNLGLLYLVTGQGASAYHHLSTCLGLRPDLGLAYLCLGVALARLGDYASACMAYGRAPAAEPLTHLNLAIAHLNQGEKGKAREAMDQYSLLLAQGGRGTTTLGVEGEVVQQVMAGLC
jgi:Flp pilus assembly protein TadD